MARPLRTAIAPLSYSLEGAAEASGLSVEVIKILCKTEKLTRRYYGTKPVILASDLQAYLESLPLEPPSKAAS